jgi:hypothetical protein
MLSGELFGDEHCQVLQLACTFLPGRGSTIDWARFRVEMRSLTEGLADPIALDLFPLDVREESEVELAVNVQPHLGFGPFSLEIGSVSAKVQRVRQLPVLVAGGLQSNVIYWQMERSGTSPISGTRAFYALTSSPDPDTRIHLTSSVVADITTQGRTFRGATRVHQSQPPISQVL